MILSLLNFFKNKTWLALLLCILPVIIYIWVFKSIALNVNYVAFDDILILGVIPGFDDASWAVKWKRLTELFPEHRLVFSRSVILLLHQLFGKINLVWAMSIGNLSQDEFNKRIVSVIKGGEKIVGDWLGTHIELRDIKWSDFIASQIKNRIQYEYQRLRPEGQAHEEILRIIGQTAQYYNYTDFDAVYLNDLDTGTKYQFDKNQLRTFAE